MADQQIAHIIKSGLSISSVRFTSDDEPESEGERLETITDIDEADTYG